MGDGLPRWAKGMLRTVDERLREASRTAKKALRLVRLTVWSLILLCVAMAVAVGLAVWDVRFLPYALVALGLATLVPLVLLVMLVSLPLRWRSLVRLIDKGYPANAKELALRVAARKLRDESLESEELLVETAINESRKIVRRYRERARRAREAATAQAERTAAEHDPLRPAP